MEIYIDLDGVTANWLKSACKHFNVDYPVEFQTVSNTFLTETHGISKDAIDNLRDNYDWWFNIEKYSWTDSLIELCRKNSDKFFILTKPMDHGKCYDAKYSWCLRNLDVKASEIIITEVPKWHFAGYNRFLIDDKQEMTDNWKQNKGYSYQWIELIDHNIPFYPPVMNRFEAIITKLSNIKNLSPSDSIYNYDGENL